MAFVQVAAAPRPSLLARVADGSLIFLLLGVPFLILAAGAPIALAIAGLLWIARQLVG